MSAGRPTVDEARQAVIRAAGRNLACEVAEEALKLAGAGQVVAKYDPQTGWCFQIVDSVGAEVRPVLSVSNLDATTAALALFGEVLPAKDKCPACHGDGVIANADSPFGEARETYRYCIRNCAAAQLVEAHVGLHSLNAGEQTRSEAIALARRRARG